MNKMKKMALSLALLCVTGAAHAESFFDNFTGVGFTVGSTAPDSDNHERANSFSISTLYNLDMNFLDGMIDLDVGASLTSTDDYDGLAIIENNVITNADTLSGDTILNVSAIFSVGLAQFLDFPIIKHTSIFAVVGVDMADNSALVAGAGARYRINEEFSVTGQFLGRGDQNTAEFGLYYHFQ